MSMKYNREDVETWRKAYEQSKRKSFVRTKFLKTRMIWILGSFSVMIISSFFIPKSDTELTLFSVPFLISFLLLVAFIDQVCFGLYLYKKQFSETEKELIT